MSCYSCGESFGVFKKEHGCKNCGYAFCTRCLSHKMKIPKLNNEKHHVCNKCFGILSGKTIPNETTGRISPPEAYKKRMAALDSKAPSSKGHSPQGASGGGSRHKIKPEHMGLSKADREIAERLEKLREKPKTQDKVTDKDLNMGLARLKGKDPPGESVEKKRYYQPPNRKTQQEEMDELLDEISHEVELDSHLPDPTLEIETRLAQLKNKESKQSTESDAKKPENNLNKSTSPEVKPYEKNIVHGFSGADNSKKQNNVENDGDVSIDEMNRLMQETAKELELDANKALDDLQKDKDLMKQLQEIKKRKKDENINKNSRDADGGPQSDSDNENEEELTNRIVEQFIEESKLDEAVGMDEVNTGNAEKKSVKPKMVKSNSAQFIEDDELPYCCICTEDATIRCHGCDLDLYCSRCWSESHKECEMEDHKTSKYTVPKDKT